MRCYLRWLVSLCKPRAINHVKNLTSCVWSLRLLVDEGSKRVQSKLQHLSLNITALTKEVVELQNDRRDLYYLKKEIRDACERINRSVVPQLTGRGSEEKDSKGETRQEKD